MKKEIYLIPYSHLDTQWRWEYPTTISDYIKNTLDESIYLFDKYENHTFNFTGTIRYNFMKEYFPQEYEKVKKLIKENRWHLAGTCLDETDALIPNMESMIRNILYGDLWQKEEFGKSSLDYMIPDCFGFPCNMPTVLHHCNINGFSSNKLTWKSAVGVPFELGILKATDGSQIVSALNPCKYDSHMKLPIQYNYQRKKRLNNLVKKNDIHKSFQYYGVGDIGGAPTEGSVKRVLKSIDYYDKKNKDIIVKQGSSTDFFKNISEEEKSKMDTYTGDLLLINHSAGVLTSNAIMKRWNRKNEQLAYASELSAVMAKHLTGLVYPKEKIREAWTRVIASQMHDILPGTCTPLAYDYSENDEVVALKMWESILYDSAKAIGEVICGEGEFLLFNPLEEEREDLVKISMPNLLTKEINFLEDDKSNTYRVFTYDNILYFKPKLKGMSYTKFKIVDYMSDEDTFIAKEDKKSILLENNYVKVVIKKSGEITEIVNKEKNQNILNKPIAYEFQHERPVKFPAWNMDWKDRKKHAKLILNKADEVKLTKNNQLFAEVKLITNYKDSKFVKKIVLTKDSKAVEFKEEINWYMKGYCLKVAIDTNIKNPVATYNWESCRMERGVNSKKEFEVPSRLWANFGNKEIGFSIIENSKYGYDRPEEGKIRLTLLYTPKIWYINGFWDQRYQDFGHHTIKYSININNGDFSNVDTLARQFNLPTRSYYIEGGTSTKRKLGCSSFIKCSNSNIGISAVKEAELDNGTIVRLYEREGEYQEGVLTFQHKILDAYIVNGKEEILKKAIFEENKLSIDLVENGLKAYKVYLEHEPATVTDHKNIQFQNNCKIIGINLEDGFFPYNLVKEKIFSGNIIFNINKEEKFNGMYMDNQTLDTDGYNTLSLLICSNQDKILPIKLDENKNIEIEVFSKSEKIGQWDKRQWKNEIKHHIGQKNNKSFMNLLNILIDCNINIGNEDKRDYAWFNPYSGVKEGYVKKGRLEYFTTHCHVEGLDKIYEFGYLFRVDIPLGGAKNITLPKDKDTTILSAVLSNQNVKLISAQYLEDKYDF